MIMLSLNSFGNSSRAVPAALRLSRAALRGGPWTPRAFATTASATPRTLGRVRPPPAFQRHDVKSRYMSSATKDKPSSAAETDESDILCSVGPAPAGGQGNVATITLSNPKRLNSLSFDVIKKLGSTLRSLASDPNLRCVVIRGAPTATKAPSFTSGANIYQMAKLKSYDEATAFISQLHESIQAIRDLPVVTVAQIDGLCLGGGLELAAACDFRYATRRSSFSMPETKYGIPSVIEARLLANIIGWQKTKEMVYFAKFYDAEEVEKWGLVDRCCDSLEALEEAVAESVASITSFGPQTMREQKRLVKIWEEEDLVTGIEAGVDSYARMFRDGGSEPGHYMKAFTERKR